MNYIFISGPIRPNIEKVKTVIKNNRSQFPNSKIFFSTWKISEDISEIKQLVDYFIETEEPNNDFIYKTISGRTYQQISHGGLEHWTLSFYKMFYGIQVLFSYIEENNLEIPNKVIRTRSDLMISFNEDYIKQIMIDSDSYFVYDRINSGVNFCDLFGVSSFDNMKKVWYYKDLSLLNNDLKSVWNIEELIKKRSSSLNLSYLDKSKIIDFYIFKPDFLQKLE